MLNHSSGLKIDIVADLFDNCIYSFNQQDFGKIEAYFDISKDFLSISLEQDKNPWETPNIEMCPRKFWS